MLYAVLETLIDSSAKGECQLNLDGHTYYRRWTKGCLLSMDVVCCHRGYATDHAEDLRV